MKRVFLLILGLLLALSAGCMEGVPLDKYCYVLDLGIERGERMPYRFVFLLNRDGEGEPGQEGGGVSVVHVEERSLFDAIEALSGALSAQLSFERATLLAFSREIAESGEIPALTDGAWGRLKIRQNIRVIILEADLISAFQGFISPEDPTMSRLKANVKLYMDNFGYVEDWGMSRMREAFRHQAGDALLPYAALVGSAPRADMAGGLAYPYTGGQLLGEGQMKTSLAGSAVFSGGRMKGVLSGQHTMLVLMANGGFRAGHLRLPSSAGELNLALYRVGRPQRRLQDGVFTCRITLEADLERPERVDLEGAALSAEAEAYLSAELARVFSATAAAGADVFFVGAEAMGRFFDWESWESYDFAARLGKIVPDFQVRVKLSHSPRDPALE